MSATGAGEYREKLKDAGYHIRIYADSMLDNAAIRKTDERTVTLVKITQKDLGLTGKNANSDILAAAEKKGLKACPAWVGPQYRLDCGDDEHTLIGTENPYPTQTETPACSVSPALKAIVYSPAMMCAIIGIRVASMYSSSPSSTYLKL